MLLFNHACYFEFITERTYYGLFFALYLCYNEQSLLVLDNKKVDHNR